MLQPNLPGDFHDTKGLSNVLTFFQTVIVIGFAILFITYINYADLFNSVYHDTPYLSSTLNVNMILYNRWEAFTTTFRIIDLLLLPMSLLIAVLFMIWVYRSTKNLGAFGCEGLRYSPGWAVGWFFIPLANLVMPVLVMTEISKASQPYADQKDWRSFPLPAVIPIWWAIYIGTFFVSLIIVLINRGPAEEKNLTPVTISIVILCSWEILWAVLSMCVIRRITAQQGDKYERLLYQSIADESGNQSDA